MYGYIYKTTDLETNKIYVGQHKSKEFDSKYFGSGIIIHKLISKYGTSRFTCEVLEWCNSLEELNAREIFWIKELNSLDESIGYNIASGGAFGDSGYHQGMLGKHQSDYQKAQARKANSYIRNSKIRANMSKSKIGNTNASGGKNLKYIHFGYDLQIRVPVLQIPLYLDQGWECGKCQRVIDNQKEAYRIKYANGTYITNGIDSKFVSNSELNYYLDNGWTKGKGPKNYINRKKKK